MSWFNFGKKSKYTPPRPAWDGAWNDDEYGYGQPYKTYAYKPRYNMSEGLEWRVTQLIKTVTGKTVTLVKANGWGSDKDNFFYNPEDLQNATDDEVLGRILQQLAKDVYFEGAAFADFAKHDSEQGYRHLLDSLEANRADRQLGVSYMGTRYYVHCLWDVRKYTDNPFSKYVEFKDVQEWLTKRHNVRQDFFERQTKTEQKRLLGLFKEFTDKNGANLAWEFCFNLHAYQNGEREFDFSDEPTANKFSLALPFVEEYLAAPTFAQALAIYPNIKKYYPKPSPEQEQQMDEGMGKTQGLSQEQMKKAVKQQIDDLTGSERDAESFKRDFAVDNVAGVMANDRLMETYRQYLALHQNQVNVLAKLLKSVLQDNEVKRFNRPFKRGKLDGKRMYKLLATNNLRVFKQPKAMGVKRYVFTLVVDMSGSMQDSKSKLATQAAIVLAEVLEQLNLPYEVLAYNGHVYTVKAFNRQLDRAKLPVLEFANGDNNEPGVIETLMRHLPSCPSNSQKVVFWVTDGEAYNEGLVKAKLLEFEPKYNCKIFGIGLGQNINRDHLEFVYPHSVKVDTINELPTAILNLLRGQFRRV